MAEFVYYKELQTMTKKMTKKPSTKPRLQKRELLDYNECVRWIEKKYKIQTRDYASKHDYFDDWCNAEGLPKKDADGNDRNSSQIFWKQYQKHPKGAKIEPPYQDFWHWIVDGHQINNGCIFSLTMDYKDAYNPSWVNEILKMFHDEFKKHIHGGCLEFECSW